MLSRKAIEDAVKQLDDTLAAGSANEFELADAFRQASGLVTKRHMELQSLTFSPSHSPIEKSLRAVLDVKNAEIEKVTTEVESARTELAASKTLQVETPAPEVG